MTLEPTWVGQVLSRLNNDRPDKLVVEGTKEALLALARCIREEGLEYDASPVGSRQMLLSRR